MTDCIRYGILGCGMMGREHIKNLALTNNAEIGVIAPPMVKRDHGAAQAMEIDSWVMLLRAMATLAFAQGR